MAHRDGAARAADTVASPAEAAPADALTTEAPATVETPDDVTGTAASPDTPDAPEPGGRLSRLPRPSAARTPSFGLSLAAIRQRNASSAEGTAALRRSLADKEAQTNELREALDALRRTLDDTAPPNRPAEPPATGRRRRRHLLLVLVAALVVGAVVGTFLLTRGGSTTTTPAPAPAVPAATGPSSGAPSSVAPSPSAMSPSASATTPVPAVATTPMPWRDGPVLQPPGLPATGPGIDAPGTDVTFAIDRDLAHIDVYERAVFSSPQPSLTLALPASAAWGSTLAGVKPVVDDLQVELDGVAVRATREGQGWFAIPPAGRRVTTVVLRYRLSGTFVNVNGQASPRRLIGVPSFTGAASSESADPVIMRIDDPRVLSLTCLSAATGSTVCQKQTGTTFTATLPTDASPVAVLAAELKPLR